MWCWLAVGGSALPFVLGWRLLGGRGSGGGDSGPALPRKFPSAQELQQLESQMPLRTLEISHDH